MAVTTSNIIGNHRGVYFEVVGDGATTALTVSHGRGVHANQTAQAIVVTAPTSFNSGGKTGKGGFVFPEGTAQTVSSVSVTTTAVTVNTSSALGNGTKAYVAVVFDQTSVTN